MVGDSTTGRNATALLLLPEQRPLATKDEDGGNSLPVGVCHCKSPIQNVFHYGEQKAMKFRVCNTCVKGVVREFFAYREPPKINKLSVINTADSSDSPRLHQCKLLGFN